MGETRDNDSWAKLETAFEKGALSRANLEDKLYDKIQDCLRDWKGDVKDAINATPMPEEEEAQFYWAIALLGNMLWAAACLVPVTAPVAVAAAGAVEAGAVARVGLAGVGLARVGIDPTVVTTLTNTSAAAQKAATAMTFGASQGAMERLVKAGNITGPYIANITGENVEYDARQLLIQAAAEKTDALSALLKDRRYSWAYQWYLEHGTEITAEQAHEYTWNKMFPRVRFEHRSRGITDFTLNKVRLAFKEFQKQWAEWKSQVEEREFWAKAAAGAHPLHGGLPHTPSVRPLLPPDPGPFKPKLEFDKLVILPP